jgi:HlyD family type I secretion membrane fusion protein
MNQLQVIQPQWMEGSTEALDDPRRDVRLGGAIAFFFFVVLLGWAAFVPLDAGVHAAGAVAVSGNRQSVQHREGGVVTAIRAREGQRVAAGQLLVEMSAPDLRASERALTSDYLTLLAQRSRLMAEAVGQSDFPIPAEFAGLPPEDQAMAAQALALQRSQLRATQASLQAQQGVLGQRSRQLSEQQSGYAEQRGSLQRQQQILADQIAGLKELEKRGFAATNRVREAERLLEELRGRESAMSAEVARAGEGMGETRMQSLSVSSASKADVAKDIRDTQAKLSEVLPRLVAAREQLARARVRAPVAGTVVGLSVFTVGGVVAPGQTLMDIVPSNPKLVIQAQVDPRGADDIHEGQIAQVRFSSVEDRSLPLLSGRVRTISADAFQDEKTGRSFYRAEVEVSPEELRQVRDVLGGGQLRPGLPVELVFTTRKRTALQYLFEPLSQHLWRSLREA